MPTIEISNLTKVFYPARSMSEWIRRPWNRGEPLMALADLSMRIEEGELVCVIGPNGAGKTTLLKILATLVLPTSGTARVHDLCVQRESRRVRASVGFVPSEGVGCYPRLTGRQNLEFFAALYGLSRARTVQRITDVVELLDIASPDQRYQEYSTGMKQRLLLARALLHDPAVLLLDEPTKSLDPIHAKQVQELIVERVHRARRKTVVVTTHQLYEAQAFGHQRLVLLSGGSLRADGPCATLAPGGDLLRLLQQARA